MNYLRLIISLALTFALSSLYAQGRDVEVTFHVDMSLETVENGVWIAGGTAGNPGFEMLDEDGDHVYSKTLLVPENAPFTYKFSNGPINADWSGPYEVVPAECGVGEYLDREVMVGGEDMMLPPVVFGTCGGVNPPLTDVNVTFYVDMQFEAVENGVWLAGGTAGNPGYEMMQFELAPGFETIYNVTLTLEEGLAFSYKFVNGPIDENWGGAWEEVPAECGVGDFLDREILVQGDPEGNMFLPPVVFGECTVNLEAEVTFHVDMQYEFVDRGVFLNDQNCYWQSICSGEIVHRASFLTGEFVSEATSGGQDVDRSVLLNDENCYWQ